MRLVKIIFFTVIALAALFVVLLGANFLVASVAFLLDQTLGLNVGETVGGWGGAALIVALIYLLPKGALTWNRPYKSSSSVLIDVPVDEIWDALKIRPRDAYFLNSIKEIRAVKKSPGEYHMAFEENHHDPASGDPAFLHIKMTSEMAGDFMSYEVLNAADMAGFARDHLTTEIALTPQPRGIKVSYTETYSRVTPSSFFALLTLSPARDAVTSLKAKVEGRTPHAWLRKW